MRLSFKVSIRASPSFSSSKSWLTFSPSRSPVQGLLAYTSIWLMRCCLRSVYSRPSKTLSICSNSSWRFFTSSFSRFLLVLSHFKALPVSPSASPRVTPLSDALSSRRFRTLTKGTSEHHCSLSSQSNTRGPNTPMGEDGSDCELQGRKVLTLRCRQRHAYKSTENMSRYRIKSW